MPDTSQRTETSTTDGPAGAESGLGSRVLRAVRADPDVIRYAAWVSVWGRWFLWAVSVVELIYRAELWFDTDRAYLLLQPPLLIFNGLTHFRLQTGRAVTWRWLLFLSAMDVALITGIVVIGGYFHFMAYVTYYPALALFAVVFTSLWFSLAWATMVAAVYSVVSLTITGIDYDLGQEKALLTRVMMMYGVVACVSLIARFERVRRQESAERERELHRERIELSQAIHDTAAQTAYMVSMGIHRAMRLTDGPKEKLDSTLAATLSLSRSAMWELRRPIDEGHLFEGRELSRVLMSHVENFGQIASVPAELVQTGTEPALSVETRTRLFSIAHNALTNAFVHAEASKVEVRLDFGSEAIRLSVSDDGVGLPDDYAEKGRGFRGMKADAERLNGRLIVETGGPNGGTTVTCEAPYE